LPKSPELKIKYESYRLEKFARKNKISNHLVVQSNAEDCDQMPEPYGEKQISRSIEDHENLRPPGELVIAIIGN